MFGVASGRRAQVSQVPHGPSRQQAASSPGSDAQNSRSETRHPLAPDPLATPRIKPSGPARCKRRISPPARCIAGRPSPGVHGAQSPHLPSISWGSGVHRLAHVSLVFRALPVPSCSIVPRHALDMGADPMVDRVALTLNNLVAAQLTGKAPGQYADGGGLWLLKRTDCGAHRVLAATLTGRSRKPARPSAPCTSWPISRCL
jgi:hypothetical protein